MIDFDSVDEAVTFESEDEAASSSTLDVIVDTEEELTEVQRGFRERLAAEEHRKADITDTAYYACICFQSSEQLDAFLAALQIEDDSRFLDGVQLSKRLGITIPKCQPWPRLKTAGKVPEGIIILP